MMKGNRGVYRDKGSLGKTKPEYDFLDVVRYTNPLHPRHHLPYNKPPPKPESYFFLKKKYIFEKLSHLREKGANVPFRFLLLFFRGICLVIAVPLFIVLKEIPLALIKLIGRLLYFTWGKVIAFFKRLKQHKKKKSQPFFSFHRFFIPFPKIKFPVVSLKNPFKGLFKRKKKGITIKKQQKKSRSILSATIRLLKMCGKGAAFLIKKVFGWMLVPFYWLIFPIRKIGSYAKLPRISFPKISLPKLPISTLRLFAFTWPKPRSLRFGRIKKMSKNEAAYSVGVSVAKLGFGLGKKRKGSFLPLMTRLRHFFIRKVKKIGSALFRALVVIADIFRPIFVIFKEAFCGLYTTLKNRSRFFAVLFDGIGFFFSFGKLAILKTGSISKKGVGLFVRISSDFVNACLSMFLWVFFVVEYNLIEAKRIAHHLISFLTFSPP